MHAVDWCIVAGLLLCWTVTIFTVRRYTRSVADYLAASRCAGRYLITVSGSTLTLGAFTFIGFFEAYYKAGFPAAWWQLIMTVQFAIVSISGWVAYRFRQTRAMTLAQFLELRYSRRLRIFAGMVAWLSGVVNFGVFPAVGSRFLIHYCGLPDTTGVFALVMAFLLGFGLLFTFLGGQIAILLTDFIQGFFSNLVILVVVFFLLASVGWGRIIEGLSLAPSGQSLVNPFDAAKMEDFNLWFFLIIALMSAYGACAWQSAQGFGVCALNAHEARMAGVLATWRVPGLYLTILLIAVCAYTVMHHPAYAPLAQQAQGVIATIPNTEIQRQMTTPIAMTYLLPPGLLGAFAALILGTTIGSHESFLQAWGSVFVQDVLMPLRARPLEPKQHLRWLRLSSLGVGLLVFCFSFLFRQTEYLHMFFVISYAIFTSGAGAVVIGGLYWKRGTTAGAWAALVTGAVLSIAAVVVRQIENTTQVFSDPARQGDWLCFILGKIASRNPAVLSVSVAAIACTVYVLVSLLYRRSVFNLDQMLHRGQYVVQELRGTSAVAPSRGWRAWIGMGNEFTRSDQIVYLSSLAFTALLIAVFLIGTIYNIFVTVPAASWVRFWGIYATVVLAVSVIIAILLTIGGVYDLKQMLRLLARIKRNPLDDGTVIDHQNRDERREAPQPNPGMPDDKPLLRSVAQVLRAFDLGAASETRHLGGTATPKFAVQVPTGRFVVRARPAEFADEKFVRFDHECLWRLAERSLPVPCPRRRADGTSWFETDQGVFEVLSWIEGDLFRKGDRAAIAEIGRFLARFHLALSENIPAGKEGVLREDHPDLLVVYVEQLRELARTPQELAQVNRLAGQLELVRASLERELYPRLPQAVIHGDIHPGNVKFRGAEVAAVYDFDYLSQQARCRDLVDALMFFAAGRRRRLDPDDIRSLTQPFVLQQFSFWVRPAV